MENTPKKYNLEERLINFAVMVLNLADQIHLQENILADKLLVLVLRQR
jgi:hypothetical protein